MFKFYKNRYFRTIFLALFATATFVGSAITIFDVDPKLMLQFFVVSVFGLAIIVLAALLFTAARIVIRHFFSADDDSV